MVRECFSTSCEVPEVTRRLDVCFDFAGVRASLKNLELLSVYHAAPQTKRGHQNFQGRVCLCKTTSYNTRRSTA